jgi:hypothetical protein
LEPTIVWPDVPRHAPNAGKKHKLLFSNVSHYPETFTFAFSVK